MRVLIFAFGGSEDNPNLPANYPENSVVYTGTHDTNTVKGWFTEEATPKETGSFSNALGKKVSETQVSREFIRLALESKANLSIIPLQDVLGLGSEARMNHPARKLHNWEWRVKSEQFQVKTLSGLQN